MNQSTSFITRGENTSMQNYEIDRLFGQAVTDRRFFRQLCERPHQVLPQFELDELEAEAVLGIALQVSTVGELADRLDAWMMQRTAETRVAIPVPQTSPALQNLSLSPRSIESLLSNVIADERFGKHPLGHETVSTDLVVTAPSIVEFKIPAFHIFTLTDRTPGNSSQGWNIGFLYSQVCKFHTCNGPELLHRVHIPFDTHLPVIR